MADDGEKSIEVASQLSQCQTLKGFMRKMNTLLLKYFGFEAITVMFLDPEKDELYTITFGEDDERAADLEYALSKAKEEDKATLLALDGVRDLCLNEKQLIYFPRNIGLTS